MIKVEYRNIAKVYNPGLFKKKVLAVDGLNLQVRSGEVFGLIGPNGAGKSTTIRLLLGLIRPSQGEIYYQGAPLASVCVQKEIGYLPENPYLYDHLTLEELLTFCGSTSGMPLAGIQTRGVELMARLDLTAACRRPLRTFSKGMLQRAGICFALMHDPAMVILDEPMSGLDPIGRKMVFDLVKELKERGKTIFFCSHILNDVERLCDRIGIMVGGRLVDEMDAAVFAQEEEASLSIEVAGSSEALLTALSSIGSDISTLDDRCVIRCAKSRFCQAVKMIDDHAADILSCRTSSASLEDRFLRAVEGGLR